MSARGPVLGLAAAAISGVSVFVNSYGVRHVRDATAYTSAKNAVAALVLLLAVTALTAARRPALTVPAGRRHLPGLGAIAVIGGSVPFVLFFEGMAHLASGPVQAQFLNKTLVLWVALLAVPVLRERLGLLQVAALALLVAGQAALSGGPGTALGGPYGRGEALILAATLLWAVEVVVAKRLLRELSSWTVALARMVLGSVLLLGWVLVSGRGARLAAMDAQQWRWVLLTGVLLAGYVAVWLAALAAAPAVTVTALLVAAVPVTALLQALVQHAPLQAGGLSLVAAGCVLAVLTAAARRPTVAPT